MGSADFSLIALPGRLGDPADPTAEQPRLGLPARIIRVRLHNAAGRQGGPRAGTDQGKISVKRGYPPHFYRIPQMDRGAKTPRKRGLYDCGRVIGAMVYAALAEPSARSNTDARPEFTADGYSLYAGGALLLFGPPDAVDRIATSLNAAPPTPGGLAMRVMSEIQTAGGGVFLPRDGLRGEW